MLFAALKRACHRKHRLFGTETAEFRRLARKRRKYMEKSKTALMGLKIAKR